MTIACATHFSPTSDDAVHVAAALARKRGERLLLASVMPEPLFREDGARTNDVAIHLELEASRLRREGLEVGTELLHGPLDAALSRVCRTSHASLLVAGDSREEHALFLSGALDQLTEGVAVPLLIIRSVRPFDAWARGLAPLRVMLAADQSWGATLARDWVRQLAEFGPLELIACRVWHPEVESSERALLGRVDDRRVAELERRLRHETEEALLLLPDNVKRRVRLEVGRSDVGQLLVAAAQAERVDLLVLGTHRHRTLLQQMRSISHRVLSGALMSVAFVPEESGGPAAPVRVSH